MAQTIEQGIGRCPLCGEKIDLNFADSRVAAKWQDVLAYRDTWGELSNQFRELRSLEEAAARLSMPSDQALRVLDFLCIELSGCRAVTCVSCLDDYRSEL